MTLEEHDKRFHPNGFDERKGRCKFRKRMSKNDGSDTIQDTPQYENEFADVVARYKGTNEWMRAPNGSPTNLTERQWIQVRTPSFKKWFGDWENDPTNASKIVDENGEPKAMYHGTVRNFYEFSHKFSNPEGDMGCGYYFTDSDEDVEQNYASQEGPDLIGTIERRAEEIESDSQYSDDSEYRIDGRPVTFEEAKEIARKEMEVGEPVTMECFLNIRNPFVLAGNSFKENNENGGTILDFNEDYDEEKDEYGEATGKLVEVIKNLGEVLEENDNDPLMAQRLYGEDNYDGMTASEFVDKAKECMADAEGEYNGRLCLMANEFIRQAIERTGYDGVIDKTVDAKFGSSRNIGKKMSGVYGDTSHVIVFNETNIKSATENKGGFNKEKADVRDNATPSIWKEVSAQEKYLNMCRN